jgi:AraC-like DNA-binding protein
LSDGQLAQLFDGLAAITAWPIVPGGQRLSTRGIDSATQFTYWREAVCDTFVGLDVHRDEEGPFVGEIARHTVGDQDGVSFIDVASSPAQIVTRSPRQIRRVRDNGWVTATLQLEGMGVGEQSGNVAVLRPGDISIFDTTLPYRLRFGPRFRQLALKMPRDRMLPLLPRPPLWLAGYLSRDTPLGCVIGRHLVTMASVIDTVDPALLPALIDQLFDLVALGFTGAARDFAGSGSTVRQTMVARAKRYAEHHLADPELDAVRIALALRISPGYLHQLFRETGMTVGDFIKRQRLAKCRKDLGNPALVGVSVTEIATGWGFTDMPHFSRSFRALYGVAPRDYRMASTANRLRPPA